MCFYICMIQILKLTNINEIIQRYKYIQYIIQLLLVCRASNAMPPLILMHRTTCFPSHLISVLSSDLQSLMFISIYVVSSHHRVSVASFAHFVVMWPSEEAKCRVAKGCHVTMPESCRLLRCVASACSYVCSQ